MVSMTVYTYSIVILAIYAFGSSTFVKCHPTTEILEEQLYQQQQHKQQQEQAEEISESFLHEVKQLIEQKLTHSLEATDSSEDVITTPDYATDHSATDEHNGEESTQSESEPHDSSRLAPISPRPKQVNDWPKLDLRLGQVVAISIGVDGHPVIFHRADRIWTAE